ncbi:DUF1566 domain-containing protein [Undibacterium sp. Rencai35W]|uniref:Lcl C-terminal domain-containing protein n=1 Tax=Undibacterium sp. Rencai35W TaxID=3413046 RepID=UPI003BF45172
MRLIISLLFLAAIAQDAHAQTSRPSIPVLVPSGSGWRFHGENFVLANDLALDRRTGKTWARCNYGQTWDRDLQSCAGTPKWLTQRQALAELQSSPDGWRLPSADELLSVIKGACPPLDPPQLRPVVFPGLLPRLYISTTRTQRGDRALAVDGCFADRPIDTSNEQVGHLLLVRDTAPAAGPK